MRMCMNCGSRWVIWGGEMHKVSPKLSPGADAPLNVPQWIKDSRDKHRAANHNKDAKKEPVKSEPVKTEIIKTERMTAAKTVARPSARRSSSSVPSSSLSEDSLQQHQQRAQQHPSRSSAAASSVKEEIDWENDQEMDFTSENELAQPVDSTLGSWDDMESVSMVSGKSGRARKIGTITVDEEDI